MNRADYTIEAFTNTETGEIEYPFKYRPASPLQYRADCSKGRFNLNGKIDAGDRITIRPVAWRAFEDELFDYGERMKWLELFFIDKNECVSSVLFHNYSREEFEKEADLLYYRDIHLGDCEVSISFTEKTTQKGNKKYYIAAFDIQEAKEKMSELEWKFIQDTTFCRKDTITDACVIDYFHNYPTDLIPVSHQVEKSEPEPAKLTA